MRLPSLTVYITMVKNQYVLIFGTCKEECYKTVRPGRLWGYLGVKHQNDFTVTKNIWLLLCLFEPEGAFFLTAIKSLISCHFKKLNFISKTHYMWNIWSYFYTLLYLDFLQLQMKWKVVSLFVQVCFLCSMSCKLKHPNI